MTTTAATPARIVWAVNQLPIRPDHRVLEIGPGRGAAAELVCERLAAGSYLGIDRSATAVKASSERNQKYVDKGKAQFQQLALEGIDPRHTEGSGRFDIVFSINVNLFWTRPARRELELIRQLLGPDGQLFLFYQAPTAAATSRISNLLSERLEQARWSFEVITETVEGSRLFGFRCSPQ
jgi:SAM-dependent methyltransferase